MDRMKQQIAFLMEIDKVKNIFRQTYLADGKRKENDAEHSWHLALMAVLLKEYAPENDAEHAWHMAIMTLLLSEYANEEIDVLRVISMLLIHDLVEIDAGDTYAYDQAGLATQRARETKAADRIFGMLPEDQDGYFRELWDEFEAYESDDAKFAHLLDNFQPLLLNDAAGGISWTEHQVKKSQIYKRNEKVEETSATIWKCMQDKIDKHIQAGHVLDE